MGTDTCWGSSMPTTWARATVTFRGFLWEPNLGVVQGHPFLKARASPRSRGGWPPEPPRRWLGLPEGCSPPTQLCGWPCTAAARNLPPSATKDWKVPFLAPSLQHHKPLPRSRSSPKTYSTVWETDLQPYGSLRQKTRGWPVSAGPWVDTCPGSVASRTVTISSKRAVSRALVTPISLEPPGFQ